MSTGELDSRYFQLHNVSDNVAVATFLPKKLTDEDNVESLGQALNGIVEKSQQRQVILDVSSIEYVTSSVIGKWIMLHRKLDREGGKLVMCSVQPSLATILGAAKLMTYFNVTPDVTAACEVLDTPAVPQTDASA